MAPLDFEQNALIGEDGTGIMYVATDYDGIAFPDGTGANESAIITDIETDYVFGNLGYFEKFSPFIKNGDEKIIETDYQNVGELMRKKEGIPGFSIGIQEILDMDNLALVLGKEVQTVAAATGAKGREIIGMKRRLRTTPYLLFKFVSCPDAQGLSNVFYFVRSALVSDITFPYVNLAREDFAGVNLEFEIAKGGNFLIDKQVAPAL